MIAAIFLTVLFMGILYLQLPPLIKKKNLREIISYSVMMAIGIIYSYGYALDIELPNPTKAVDAVFRPLTKLLDTLLGG